MIIFGISLTLVSCTEQVTESIKNRQAFEIFTAGEYTLLDDCPAQKIIEGSVVLASSRVQIDHTVCDVKSFSMSENPAGHMLKLKNCRSDGDVLPERTIVISAGENGNKRLNGWGDAPKPIIKCEYQ